MRNSLLIDGLPLLGQVSGVGRYSHEVCARLPDDVFRIWYYYGYLSRRKQDAAVSSALSRLKGRAGRFKRAKSVARRLSSLASRLGSWDLHWQPNFIPLPGVRARRVAVTVHDFSWEIHAPFHPRERVEYFRKHFYPGIEAADRIITVSHYVRGELIERLPHLADRIQVIHNGYDHRLYAPPGEERPRNYLLSVGNIEPRKNLLGLLRAYAGIAPEIRRQHPLLLIGAAGWKNREIFQLIDQMDGDVRYLGYVSDQQLADYYREALCFVYPSFYEGFGLPPLEAMACGTPVIASNVSSLPEVCGEAACYVDPEDVEAIRSAILAFIGDPQLRHQHAARGLTQAARFSWDRSAAEHLALFKELAGP